MSQVPVFQVLENLRSVLVVLIPVGQISQEKFITYAQHVSSCTSFALQEYVEFNHPPTQGATLPGGFDHRNWNRDIIHLRYEIQHSHSDWEELFLFQKPFAVVGIADCSVENDLTATFNKFSTLTSRYRISPSTSIMQQGTVPKTCLAFELRKDQKDPDLGTFKVIPDQDFAHFNFYITHIFGEELVRAWLPLWENTVKADPELLADLIFDSLYGGSDNVSNPSTSHTALLTQLDSDWPDEAPKGRKRRLVGRIRKQQGDLCLFAGSPIDALNQYRIAIEILRSCSDWEWVGSALESSAAAIISLREATREGLLPADIQDISSKLSEARTCYSRRPRATYLECENLIRSAVFFQKAERHLEMADMLSKCQEIVELLDPANLMGRIQLYSAIALVYRNANFTRKYAFFIQLVCRLCLAAEVPAARAHQLLEQVAPEYDITANSLIEPVTGKPAVKTRRAQLIDSGAPWSKLQASILSLLIDLSTVSGNTVQSIKYLVYMMREVAPQLLRAQHTEPSLLAPNKTDWSMKLKQLSMQMPPPLDTAEGDPLRRGLGMLTSWKALKDQGMYMHISRSVSDPLFLYRPNRKAKEAIAASASHVFAWPGHTIYFDVSLRNSMAQKAILEDVRISFSVIVLTTTEIRAGDTRMDVDYLPPITVEACIQPSAQIVIDPGDSITVKLSALVPNLRNIKPVVDPETDEDPLANLLKDSRFKILLAPSELTYSMFNCPFSESMLKMFNTPVKQLLLICLHYVHNVPTVSVEDSSHPWISYTTATRDPDLVIAMSKASMVPVQPILSAESRLNVTLSQESQPESKSSAPTKSVHHLTIATSQLRGERLLTTLVLKNESIYDVEDFGLTIQENGETISPTKPSQVLIGEPKAIYDIISKALPLRPGERLELPLEFMAPGLGLVQVSFLMEYRNNVSAENMWRKLRMDYSFKVVESLKPLKVDVLQCSESSLEVLDRSMPHRVIVVGDEREITIDTLNEVQDEESYLLLMLSIQNKTMVSFHCAKDDQIADGSSMDTHHTTFVVDPWGTKNFCMALHRQTFVRKMEELITQGASPSFEQACRDFFTAHLRISWRSYGNRVGTILFDANLIEDAILKKLRPQRVFTKTWMVDMKGSRILARPSEESRLPSVHLQSNQIYKLNTEVHCLNSPRVDNTSTYFSALCKTHHLNNQARNYSWIGKAQNIALPHIAPGHSTSAQVPIVFHHPGVYTISVRVHDAHIESPEDYWSRDISIIVVP